MRLKDRVAIVTGGAKGIGRASARELARQGARVVGGDIDRAVPRGSEPCPGLKSKEGPPSSFRRM